MNKVVKCVIVLMMFSLLYYADKEEDLSLTGTLKQGKTRTGEKVFVLLVNKTTKVRLPESETVDLKKYLNKKIVAKVVGSQTVKGKNTVYNVSEVKDISEFVEEEKTEQLKSSS